jgi:hypothetical protein
MVLLGQRGTEQRHEPVASELRRGTSITVHLGKASSQKRADQVAHRLGSQPFRQRGGTHNVAKQHADLFHFAWEHAPSIRGSRRGGFGYNGLGRGTILQTRPVERRAAVAAKPVFGRVAGAA